MTLVANSGHGAVATTDKPGSGPFFRAAHGFCLRRFFLFAAAAAAGAEQHKGFTFPDLLASRADAGENGKLVAGVTLFQRAEAALNIQLLTFLNRSELGDAIAHM